MKWVVTSVGLFVAGLILSGLVAAYEADLRWDQTPGAKSYTVEQSTDAGQTWALVGTTSISQLRVTVPDNVLVLHRITASDEHGSVTRTDAGTWVNSAWLPLIPPKNIGIQ